MCFSATSSFATSGASMLIGIANIRNINTKNHIYFAVIPLWFSLHQFIEGMLWLSLTDNYSIHFQQSATYLFTLIGLIFWPIWIPFSILKLEENPIRQKWIRLNLYLGILISVFLLVQTLINKITAEIVENHMQYTFYYSYDWIEKISGLYLIPTVFSHFYSSNRFVQMLGFLILGSFILTKIFFPNYVFSVWCFFAALISGFIFFITNVTKSKTNLA
jgi:uncharacterized membrane protein